MEPAADRYLENLVRSGVIKAVEHLVRVGNVTKVDPERHMARVQFRDCGLSSGWLYVLSAPGRLEHTQDVEGGFGLAAYQRHRHDVKPLPWLPRVNDTVLVLYLPVFNADGFILGAIKKK